MAKRPTSRDLRKIIVIPDVHIPNNDKRATNVALKAIEVVQPDHVVCIGDTLDFVSVSFHPRDPSRLQSLRSEINAGNRFLDRLEATGVKNVHMLGGNHEYRLERYLWTKAPELYGLVDLPTLLRIKERGWTWTPYRKSLKIGKIHFTHDVGRSGANTAAQSLNDYGHSIVMGHSHRAAVVYDGNIAGERRVAMNVGTLIDLETVDYRHQSIAARQWQHGIGMIHMTKDGVGWCTFCPIIGNRIVIDGKIVRTR